MNRTLSQKEKESRLQKQIEIAKSLSNQDLAFYISNIAQRAQRYTSFERIAFLNEAAKRLSI